MKTILGVLAVAPSSREPTPAAAAALTKFRRFIHSFISCKIPDCPSHRPPLPLEHIHAAHSHPPKPLAHRDRAAIYPSPVPAGLRNLPLVRKCHRSEMMSRAATGGPAQHAPAAPPTT